MRLILAFVVAVASSSAYAWDGFDYEHGAYIEIQKGQKVRAGREIEIFDYSRGEYIDVEIQSIHRHGRSVSIEVVDDNTGQERTLEMDD